MEYMSHQFNSEQSYSQGLGKPSYSHQCPLLIIHAKQHLLILIIGSAFLQEKKKKHSNHYNGYRLLMPCNYIIYKWNKLYRWYILDTENSMMSKNTSEYVQCSYIVFFLVATALHFNYHQHFLNKINKIQICNCLVANNIFEVIFNPFSFIITSFTNINF